MRGWWAHQLRQRWRKRALYAVSGVAIVLLCGGGCRRVAQTGKGVSPQPEAVYERIEQQWVRGELDAAAVASEEAARQFSPAADTKWNAVFRVQLARVYLYQGRNRESAALLEAELPSGTGAELAVRRELLAGMAEARLGNESLSRRAFAEAEALQPRDAMRAELLGAEGIVALHEGELDKAERLFLAAQQGAQQNHAPFLAMEMAINLGVVGLRRQRYEDALEDFRHGAGIAASIGNRVAAEKALGNLGSTYYQTGDSARATEISLAAAEQARSIGNRFDEAQWLINAGRSQFDLHDVAAARASFERALSVAKALNFPNEMLDAHTALAYLLLHEHTEQAAIHVQDANELASATHDPAQQMEPKLLESLLFVEQGKTREAETDLLALLRIAKNAPSYQWEAEKTLASLYDRNGQPHDAERWYRRAIATFHRQRLSLRSVELELPFLENGSDLYLGYMEHLIRAGRTDEALGVLDESRAETLAEGLGVAPREGKGVARVTAVRALAARLHGVILVYCLRPEASYLWAVSARRQEFLTLRGSGVILPMVARHTQAILASKDLLAQGEPTGRELYDALVRPAEGVATPGSRVFLIADKGLDGLNFETLLAGGERPHYWIEDVTLSNARSLRLLAASRAVVKQPDGGRLLLIGNPVYRAGEYPALPNAGAEMLGVSGHFAAERRAVSVGAQALPGTYAGSQPKRFAYIHFVAHATANETNPLDSAIILSHSGDAAASYKLYARDVLDQPLQAELVTLSSCFGSGTRNYSGEGVVGLVWAFLRAGAHSVIGAMWEVSDVSTPQLMDTLYGHLLAGSRPDEALRSAKLKMLHGGGVFRKPLYWASFQLYTGR